MRSALKHAKLAVVLALPFLLLTSDSAAAQGRGRGGGRGGGSEEALVEFTAAVTFSLWDRDQIEAHYLSTPNSEIEALPPGIQGNLARGKTIPPGIAKRSLPEALRSFLSLPLDFQVFEVGLDIFLVEEATGIIHDILMDVIR